MSEFDKAFDAFRGHSTPAPEALDAMRERLAAQPPARRFPIAWAAALVLAVGGGAVFAASKLGAFGPFDSPSAAPSAAVAERAPLRPLNLPLRESGETALSPLVRLRWQGDGEVGGTEAGPQIAWLQGTLAVDVVPEHRINLVVTTDEARVAVHGTAFTVVRDALGTAITVEHGVVSVECAGAAPLSLTAGMEASCRPVHAAALLRRARELQDRDPAAALVDVDDALDDAARPALLDDELRAVRVALLARNGRTREAIDAAVAYVRGGGTRTGEVAALGLALGAAGSDALVLAAKDH